MADSPMRWVFEILDKMSGPAKKIAAGTDKIHKSLGDVDKGAKRAESSMSHFFKALVVERLGERLFDFGKEWVKKTFEATEHAVVFKENMQRAFLALDPAHGREYFDAAEKFANQIGVASDTVVQYALSLRNAGLQGKELFDVLKGAGDIFTLGGRSDEATEKMSAFAHAMAAITGKEQVAEMAIMRLQQAGVNVGDVWRHLTEDITHGKLSVLEFQKAVTQGGGKISAAAIRNAALESIVDRTHRPLGEFAQGAGGADKTIQQIKNNYDRQLGQLSGGPFMKALEGALKNLRDLLADGGGLSKMIRGLLNGPAAEFLKNFTGPEGATRIKAAFEGVLTVVIALTNALATLMKLAVATLAPKSAAKTGFGFQTGLGDFVYGLTHDTFPTQSRLALPPSKTSGAHGATLNVQIHVDASGTGGDAQAIADTVAASAPGALAQVLAGLSMEQGAF